MRHRFTRRWRTPLATAVTAALFSSLLQTAARADDQPQDTAEPQRSSVVKNADRDAVLGKDWHKSQDRAWTTSGDTEGFHVLVADQNKAYAWRTAATLREPGFDADMWIGNACVTGSGKRAVVAYAPRTFTNKPELMARGAFTAVVDLASGAVTKLNRQASLAYFSPGCGTGETAVLTQDGGEDKNATRLIEVDAATGKLSAPVELKGQITSAVPVGEGFVAADSNRLVKIDKSGGRRTVAHTDRIPFQLKADAEGGVTYLDRPTGTSGPSPAAYTAPATRSAAAAGNQGQDKGEARHVTAGDIDRADARRVKPAVLARGPLHNMDLSSSATGKVFITGDTQEADQLPGSVERRTDVPKDARATTRGEALVTRTEWSHDKPSRAAEKQAPAPRSADVDLKVLNTGKKAEFRVEPGDQAVGNPAQGAEPSPALTSPARPATARTAAFHARTASSIDDTAEPDRYCSVPRNDPRKQALQPKPRQIEWAVDQAITNNLNKHISRPANWKNLGMGAYKPQSLFPLLQLEGGGRIPAQVMLGVTAQESNMWQASRVVVPGVTGNPLIGNYYGIKYAANGQQNDPWGIHWDKADCGYGITQVTDGMRIQGKEKPEEQLKTKLQQEAAALDYTANIAAGVNILADKWNQTHKDGLTVNNGDPKYMENWFFALWAYNSGYYPKSEAGKNGGKWGVGYTNNPANPLWKANRRPFLESATGGDNYKDAAHPQDWPYQEKVLGWAARPLEALESPGKMVHGFRQAWWMNFRDRTTVKPPEGLFCTADNDCDPSKIGPDDKNEPGLGACNRKDLKCWWNKPVTWKKCDKGQCGNELLRFNDTYKEEADGTAYPPNCSTSGLPGNALIVDDVPDGTPIMRPGCAQPKKNSGTFKLDFATDSAKIDFQQLGAGYGGHFWFAHTRKDDDKGQRLKTTGTWKLDKPIDKAAKVLVHIPDHGAQTTKATYKIKTAHGWRESIISQKGTSNRWVSIGAYQFKGGPAPEVQLSSITPDGTGDDDIAFDAVAFVPGDYADMPRITLPAADENAPELNYDAIPDKPLAVTPTHPVLRSAAAPAKRRMARSAQPDVPLCTYGSDSKPIVLTRNSACMYRETAFERINNKGERGTATFRVQQQIQLDLSNSEFVETLSVTPMHHDPVVGPVSLNEQFYCQSACDTSLPQWKSTPTWAPGDVHTAQATVKHKWTNSQNSDELHLSWTDNWTVGGKKRAEDWDERKVRVRCDNLFKGRKAGCVFPEYIPTYTVNTKKYPAAAALYWVLMEKLPSHPGRVPTSGDSGHPLHRLADEKAQEANRGKMCKSVAANYLKHPDTPTSSCDEYPFAASKESGGSQVATGQECVQLYTTNKNGPWELFYDDRWPLPNWKKSVCGRGSVPQKQNTSAGGGLGRFARSKRVDDQEAFYVTTPGFEGCNADDVCKVHP
ncbi:golvesin C-terminal-like domain-containing protein [Streptomyces rimosus]|uniref:golvesin C-terminal-like domain-containing protein n=1 Tax=Streptomyces rimosus TaxID=1927 RepID=UPI000A4FCDCC|nr:hypothetical protein [Streptomyces rimosus]